MKLIIVLISLLASSFSLADENTYSIKKLVDADAQTTLFLGCNSQNNCRVLANGSFKNSDLSQLQKNFKLRHNLENAAFIAGSTITFAINPYVIFSFLSVPVGVVTLVGSSAYVYFKHDNFDSYKKIALVSPENANKFTSLELLEMINKDLIRLREEINKQ